MQNVKDDDEPEPFIDYWDTVDNMMLEAMGIDSSDTGIEPDLIADAQEAGISPADFLRWLGITGATSNTFGQGGAQ